MSENGSPHNLCSGVLTQIRIISNYFPGRWIPVGEGDRLIAWPVAGTGVPEFFCFVPVTCRRNYLRLSVFLFLSCTLPNLSLYSPCFCGLLSLRIHCSKLISEVSSFSIMPFHDELDFIFARQS